ncbi:hypothetical protein SAMN04488515_2609 [Cognatiyoonia koreensis]|uniref:CAAX prenyl protease 2/Lysostaphin resistance protein A-like domain-containing protein n=2 Tax=Cognatiyoonia koreensis TaxID=364200 RepID=A0A1I0RFT4_9RHOB|nr:hypothetical protein SAMN04488515_2609 [Cognatiyoonia koreensis]
MQRVTAHDSKAPMIMRTENFERFIAPAHPSAAIWRLILGIIVIGIIYFIIVFATGLAAIAAEPTGDPDTAIRSLMSGNSRLTMTLILLSFSGAVLGVMIATVLVHQRSPIGLFGPIRPMIRHFVIAVGVFGALQACILGIWSYFYDGIAVNSLTSVVAFLPVAAGLIALQTGAEELLFRGYLLQQLGARFKSWIIWFALPAMAFGLLHYNPQMMGDLTWFAIAAITVTGLLWTDLTRVTGNIGAAWGWHFANNFMLMNFLGNKGELNGFVWMTTPYSVKELPPSLFLIDIGIAVLTWAILRRVLRD